MFALESRSRTFALGKCTAEAKTKIPEETREQLELIARAAGMSFSELLREMCIVRAHGSEVLRSVYEKRLEVVAGSGPNDGHAETPK